jgi:hypothetical protein
MLPEPAAPANGELKLHPSWGADLRDARHAIRKTRG